MRALLVTNPKATTTTARVRDVISTALSRHAEVEIAHTDHRGHAIELGQRAVRERYELVIVLGGDGTVNEVVNGLLSEGPGPHVPAIAVLPGGSANVFTRSLGVSNDPVEAAGQLLEALAQRRSRTIGLGQLDGRWFVFTAGMGFDAGVVHSVEMRRSDGHRASPSLYARTAVRDYLNGEQRRATRIRVEAAGRERIDDAFLCIVTNTTPWTYYKQTAVHLTPEASYDRGLDVFALRPTGPLGITRLLWQVTRSVPRPRGRGVRIEHDLQTIRLHAERPLPVQVDGDFAGELASLTVTHVPDALEVVC